MRILIIEDTQKHYENICESILDVATIEIEKFNPLEIYPFLHTKNKALRVNPMDFDIIFIDYDLWEDEKGGLFFGKFCKEKNPEAHLVLITKYLADAKEEKEYYKYYDDDVLKTSILDLKKTFEYYFLRKDKLIKEKKKKFQGPKTGEWKYTMVKHQEYWNYYHDLRLSKDWKEIDKGLAKDAKIWFTFIKNLVNFSMPIDIDTIRNWDAIPNPFSSTSRITDKTDKWFLNKLKWRRIVLLVYKGILLNQFSNLIFLQKPLDCLGRIHKEGIIVPFVENKEGKVSYLTQLYTTQLGFDNYEYKQNTIHIQENLFPEEIQFLKDLGL
jgi:hypothetical protein